MRRYLVVALFPTGLATIALATIRAARRGPAPPAAARFGQAGTAQGVGPERVSGAEPGPQRAATPAASTPPPASSDNPAVEWQEVAYDLVRLGAIASAGGVLSYQVMALLGPPIINNGPLIDVPIHDWINDNRVPTWAAVMDRFNKVGNTWTTWGAAGTAAACLGMAYPRKRWLPPSTLAVAVLVDKYATLALRHKFGRIGPPSSPLGTYPSGGCDRVMLFYGLIAYMLWREFSGTQKAKVYSIGTVAALGFIEAYCRAYLSKHWSTDIVSGLFYGVLLLLPFLAAVRLIAGPPETAGGSSSRRQLSDPAEGPKAGA
jgi:membrane-associated phospholipid phosphatase